MSDTTGAPRGGARPGSGRPSMGARERLSIRLPSHAHHAASRRAAAAGQSLNNYITDLVLADLSTDPR